MQLMSRLLVRLRDSLDLLRSANAGKALSLLSMLFTGTIISSGLAFLAQMILARRLSIEDFGRLAALLAAVNFFTPLGSAGVNWFLLRVFAQEGSGAVRWLRTSRWLIIALSCAGALGVVIYSAYGLSVATSQRTIVALASVGMLFGQIGIELGSCRYQLEDRFGGLALWQMVTQVGRLIVLLALMATFEAVHPPQMFDAVLIGYAAVGGLTTCAAVVLLRNLQDGQVRPGSEAGSRRTAVSEGPAPSMAQTIAEAVPFALVTMFFVLSRQGVIVVVEWLRGGVGAGFFSAAFLVFAAATLVPHVVYAKFLTARIYRWASHDRNRLGAVFHVSAVAMLGLGLALMLGLMACASWLVPLLFGTGLARSAAVLTILSVAIPLRFAQHAYSALFVSREDTARKARYLGYAALVGIVGSVILVPLFDIEGAAVAIVIVEAVLLVLHVSGTARFIDGISVYDTFRPRTFRKSLRLLSRFGEA